MYEIVIKKRMLKNIQKMPVAIQRKMANLVEDLRDQGPLRRNWPNYSRLSKNEYHCHLSHSWVACWHHERNTVAIEVYYAGSRENAPY